MPESEWAIKSRGHCCARTGRQFQEGEYFYTLLFREEEGFRREDISEEAWSARNENIEPFSFWRSKYEKPAAPAVEPLPGGDAESLLRHLLETRRPSFGKCMLHPGVDARAKTHLASDGIEGFEAARL